MVAGLEDDDVVAINEVNESVLLVDAAGPAAGERVAELLGLADPVEGIASDEHVSLAEVKNRLSEVVERLEREHGRVVITKHGRPAVVMMSLDDLVSLEETLAILKRSSAHGGAPGCGRRHRGWSHGEIEP